MEREIITNKNKKFWIIGIVAFLILSSVVTLVFYQKKQTEQNIEEYDKNIRDTATLMIYVGIVAEGMVADYYDVWRGAIYEDNFMVDGQYVDDFNEAISIQKNVFEEEGSIENLEDRVNDIEKKVKELRNPPKEYEESYEVVIRMYKDFKQYTSLALSPEGSLKTYGDKTDELVDNILRYKDEFDLRVPNDIVKKKEEELSID